MRCQAPTLLVTKWSSFETKMVWQDAAKGFREIPVGKTVKQIWYNPAILPLWGTIGLATIVCGGFMTKYFCGHTDITFSPTVRGTFDHSGLSESRCASHNTRFGFRTLNKNPINIFPFNFKPMSMIIDEHGAK
ncbi:hypothetical protein AB1Y20_019716 [Prymnesium parvum]|uniref:Uncharacterized protein n=1 Tax=Prymnesium parvum TaxID=97485 RepID=A0AB34JVQ6_PRYPA